MNKLIILMIGVFGALLLFADTVSADVADLRRNRLLLYTEQGGWKKSYTDGQWSLATIFFDLDGDGYEEVLLAPPIQHDRDGTDWTFLSLKPGWNLPECKPGDVSLYCDSKTFYSYKRKSTRLRMLCIDSYAEHYAGLNQPDGFEYSGFVGVSKSGKLSLDEKVEVEECLAYDDFEFIERLGEDVYSGYELKIEHPRLKPRLGPGCGDQSMVTNTVDIASLMQDVERTVASDDACASHMQVFTYLPVDEDNDGDPDAFLTRDTSRLKNEKFVWRLYRNEDGKFVRTDRTVIAGTNDFCRVITYTRDPQLVILGGPGGSPKDLRRIITERYFHRIERLPCRTYPAGGADSR